MSNSTIDNNDYKVADINLSDFGRKEIELAESEMPDQMPKEMKAFAIAEPGAIHNETQLFSNGTK